MKSFLLKDNKPIAKWGLIPDETYFEGEVPEGYALAVCPSENIVILDVDKKNGKNGFLNIPNKHFLELEKTFNYYTKSGGKHYFIKYTGNKILLNKATEFGLDLRIGAKPGNSGGYVKYNHHTDIRHCIHLIKESSLKLNEWLEILFSEVNNKKKQAE